MKRRVRLIEIWKPIVGYEDCYEVSNHGRVKRIKLTRGAVVGRILNEGSTPTNYRQVNLYKNGDPKKYYVHHLVLNAFVGLRTPEHECNHKDGNKTNNCLWNLEWVTHSVNLNHKITILKKGIKSYIVVNPNGKQFMISNLNKFCHENNIDIGNMINVAKGQHKHHKGWDCKYV